jgi:hypothetical protein
MIPDQLYRGDGDCQGIRFLHQTISFSQLQTNLINSGDKRLVFTEELLNLVKRHIETGWSRTHFLSFTEDINVAFHYGSINVHCNESLRKTQ